MKFITAEQFLKAEKKVRDSIMEWWKPSEYDLISYYDIVLLTKQLKLGHESIKAELIPLLTVGQLIEFIEWKTNNSLEIKITCVNVNNTLLDSLWEESQRICSK